MSSGEAPSNVGGATSGGCGLRRLGHMYISHYSQMWPFTDLEQEERYVHMSVPVLASHLSRHHARVCIGGHSTG